MSQLIDNVTHELLTQGYIDEHFSCNLSFQTALASMDRDLGNSLDEKFGAPKTFYLTLDFHHHPSNLKLSLNFCYQLSQNAQRLQCRKLSAMSEEAYRTYKIDHDHSLPSLLEVVQTLQQKLQMSPFIRLLDTVLDNMKDHYYKRIKFAESNISIVDAIQKKVVYYNEYNDSGKTHLLKVSGKYHLLRNSMDTNIILELNKNKMICQIKQIENIHDATKMIYLPGKKQHLDTPFEMLSLLSEKKFIERKSKFGKRFEQLSSPHERIIKRR